MSDLTPGLLGWVVVMTVCVTVLAVVALAWLFIVGAFGACS